MKYIPMPIIPVTQVTDPNDLTWVCQVCRKDIERDTGALLIKTAELTTQHEQQTRYDDDRADKGPWSPVNFALLPTTVKWQVAHIKCDDGTQDAWWIATNRIDTMPEFMHTVAHLLGKNWIRHTDLATLINEAAGGGERVAPTTPKERAA